MSVKAKKRPLTKAEQNALRTSVRVGLRIRNAMPLPRIWFGGYTDALRTMATLLPDSRHWAKMNRRMARIEKLMDNSKKLLS